MASKNLQDSNRDNAGFFVGELAVTQSCAPCMKSNITKTATFFCKNCDEYLCDTCTNPHTVYKTGKHDIVNFQDKKSAPVIIDMKGMDKCHEHGREIEFFCQDHSKLCCSSCVLIHRKCDQVDEIAKVSGQKRPELQALKQSLITMQSEADAIIADCKHSETDLNESIAKISSEVDNMRDRIIKLFEEAKQKLVTEAKQFNTAEVKRIANKRDDWSRVKEEISKVLSMSCVVLERGTPSQQYIYSKLMKEKRKTMESNIHDQRKIKIASTVAVSFPKELTSILEMGSNFIKLNYDGNKTGPTGEHEPKRLVKTMDFDVEKNDYSVPVFYEHFGKELPQVIMISQGFFGDIVEDTFDRDMIIRIQTVSKQRRVVARADMGDHSKLISIPLSYTEKVCVIKKHKLGKEKTIKEVVDHLSMPCNVQFPHDRTISVGGQNISTNHIPKLQLQKAFDEMYLLGNFIVDGVMGPEVVNIPLYLSQLRMARVTGLKNTPPQKWRGYLEELERFSSYLKYDKEYGNQGIAQYDPSAVHSDAVYSYVEPQHYSNIVSMFQHRHGNALDNPNYLLTDVSQHEDIKYEEIGMPRESEMFNDKTGYHRPSLATFGVFRTQTSTLQKSQEVNLLKPTHGSLKSTGQDQRASQQPNNRPLIEKNAKVPPPVAIKPHRVPPQIPEMQGSPKLPARQPRPPTQMMSSTEHREAIYKNNLPRTSIPPFRPELENAIERTQARSSKSDQQSDTLDSPEKHDEVDRPLPTVNDSLDVIKLSIHDVCGYLKVLHLDKYEPKFQEELIDGTVLAALSKEDFEKEFGMNGLEAVRIFKFSKEGHLPR